jgi:hypothetical protein
MTLREHARPAQMYYVRCPNAERPTDGQAENACMAGKSGLLDLLYLSEPDSWDKDVRCLSSLQQFGFDFDGKFEKKC